MVINAIIFWVCVDAIILLSVIGDVSDAEKKQCSSELPSWSNEDVAAIYSPHP